MIFAECALNNLIVPGSFSLTENLTQGGEPGFWFNKLPSIMYNKDFY